MKEKLKEKFSSFRATKSIIIYALTLLFALLFLIVGNRVASQGKSVFGAGEAEFWRARVQMIIREEKSGYEVEGSEDTMTITSITFDAYALSGPRKGETIRCVQQQDDMFAQFIPKVKPGDTVLIDVAHAGADGEPGGEAYMMYEFARTTPLVWLGLFYAALLIFFGRKKGFDTLLSFGFSILAIFLVLVPAVLTGRDIYGWSLLICGCIVVVNLLLVQGPGAKSVTAGLGCFSGVLCSGLVIALMNKPLHITGLLDEESIFLSYLSGGINVRSTVFCMILIGSIGALMDVAMDIAAALHELREHNPDMPARKLMASGLSIGKDLIGTMANTLVLAYIGGSLGQLLVMITYSAGLSDILNREAIAVEILQSLAGCLSMLAVVPITALFCSIFYRARPKAAIETEAPPMEDEAV